MGTREQNTGPVNNLQPVLKTLTKDIRDRSTELYNMKIRQAGMFEKFKKTCSHRKEEDGRGQVCTYPMDNCDEAECFQAVDCTLLN